MIFGYFDDSSTHEGSKVLALCGFLADPRIWEDFDNEWKKVLDRRDWPNRPREFHMYDCVHGTGLFSNWGIAARLAIYGDMVTLLCDTNLIALGSIILVDAFKNLDADSKLILAQGGLCQPIDFVFQHLLQIAVASTRKYASIHRPPIVEKLGLLFDEAPAPMALRYHQLYTHMAAKHPHRETLSGIGSGKSEQFTAIQAADMLAYTSYRWTLKQHFPEESDFDFPIVPAFLRMIQNVAAEGGVFTETSLRTLVGQELINRVNKGRPI